MRRYFSITYFVLLVATCGFAQIPNSSLEFNVLLNKDTVYYNNDYCEVDGTCKNLTNSAAMVTVDYYVDTIFPTVFPPTATFSNTYQDPIQGGETEGYSFDLEPLLVNQNLRLNKQNIIIIWPRIAPGEDLDSVKYHIDTLFVAPGTGAYYRAYLEGAYQPNTNYMTDHLRRKAILPIADPYQLSDPITPAAYAVTNRNALVDWVLLELRDPIDPSIVMHSASGLLQRDGDVVTNDGITPLYLESSQSGDFYVSIRHQNHLMTMSSIPIDLTDGHDFTEEISYENGGSGQRNLGPDLWVLYCGDIGTSGDINGQDLAQWRHKNGEFGIYSQNDINLDGDVNLQDKVLWSNNNGLFSSVPK